MTGCAFENMRQITQIANTETTPLKSEWKSSNMFKSKVPSSDQRKDLVQQPSGYLERVDQEYDT